MDNKSYNYVIIGGGLLGSATAYQLAKRGATGIAVFDRNEIATQASSRAACLLTRARVKRILMPIVQETYDCIDEIEKLTGDSLELQTTGSITTASGSVALEGLDALEEAANSFGIECSRIGNTRVKELLPWIDTSDITSSLYMPTDAYIDSSLLCSGYAAAAKILGVEYYSNCGVAQIISQSNKISGVRLDDGRVVNAPIVINAAGGWSNNLMRTLGVGLPLTPVRSHFWITEIDKEQFPSGHPFSVISDARAFTRADVGALIIGLRESECLSFDASTLTDSLEDFDFEQGAKWRVLDECAPQFKRYYNNIDNIGIAHYVAGPSCYVPDAMFVIGDIQQHRGLYTISGCCGAGVAAGGGMGRLMAEIVLGITPFVDATPFLPSRFGEVDPFSEAFQRRCAEARSNKKSG
ncbi:MAG: FAD-dependent oxidoreductase [Rikenellaceae bacterium]